MRVCVCVCVCKDESMKNNVVKGFIHLYINDIPTSNVLGSFKPS